MDPAATSSRFRTTSWTLVISARTSREDLERLLAAYWRPIYAYLRCKGHQAQDALDLTQGFIVEVVLERDLIGKAEPERGRFRSFLLKALERFVIDGIRKKKGRGGSRPDVVLATDSESLARAEPAERDDPSAAFEKQWATTVMEEAVARLREDCRHQGMEAHWQVFEAQELHPAVHGTHPIPADELARRLAVPSRDDVYNMLHTTKRKFRRFLREVVAETVEDPADQDDELTHVLSILPS